MYQWLYGTPLSGLSFPLVTASGTYAKGYDTAQLSGVLSKDGAAWTTIGGRISGVPGDGVYTIASLSGTTEMASYSWIIKITANSGCLDQTILGYNLSGYAKYADISGFAHSLDCSGNNAIMVAVSAPATSGIAAQVWNTLLTANTSTTTFGNLQNTGGSVNISSIAAQVWNTLLASNTSTTTFGNLQNTGGAVNVSAIAGQVWNSLPGTYISSTTFGGGLVMSGGYTTVSGLFGLLTSISGIPLAVGSGFLPILTAVSNVPLAVGSGWVGVSGIPNIMTAVSGIPLAVASGWVGVSGNDKILTAVSGLATGVQISGTVGINTSSVNAVRDISIADGDSLTSGTLGHSMRLIRWANWGPLIIDKTYSPNRLYLQTDNTNVSSWWSLTDNAGATSKTRGG